MSDRATINIDCDRGSVYSEADQLISMTIGRQIETTRSSLIAQLLIPQIKELMSLSKGELMKRNLEMLTKY